MPKTKEIINDKIQKIVSLYVLQDEYREKSHALLSEIKRLVLLYEKGPEDYLLEQCKKLEEEHNNLSLEYKKRVQDTSINSLNYI